MENKTDHAACLKVQYDSSFYCSCRIRHYLISFMIIQSFVTRIPSLMLQKTRYRIKHNGAVWRNSKCKPSHHVIHVLTTLMCQKPVSRNFPLVKLFSDYASHIVCIIGHNPLSLCFNLRRLLYWIPMATRSKA